ncbi:MAG: hypothetical protein M3Z36_07500 [Acidobacteriota bacterium]|nr:hypothetical protein [Acidobacteriota bacterium]
MPFSLFAMMCAAQTPIPELPLISLQYSTADGSPASPVLISVRNSGGPGVPLTITAKLSPTTQNWLRVARVSALTDTSDSCPKDPGAYVASPGSVVLNTRDDKLCITAARTVTVPGNYSGFITLAPATGSVAQVIVNLSVTPPGHLLLTPDLGTAFNENILTFATSGATTPTQTIKVDIVDPAPAGPKFMSPVTYTVAPNDFLVVQCLQQDRKTPCGPNPVSPFYLQISVAPTMTIGQLVGKIELSSLNPTFPGNDVITVQANVTGLLPMVTVDATPLVFSSIAGVAANPIAQSIRVGSNSGALNFTASAISDDGTGFLSVTPLTGAAPGTLTLTATPGALRAPGSYTGSVLITPVGGSPGTPVRIPVTLKIAGLVATPATAISFVCAPGESSRIAVSSTDPTVAIPFTATAANAPWLSIAPAGGTTPTAVTLTTNCTGLDAKTYTATLMAIPTGASTGPQIPVTLTVSPQPLLAVTPDRLAFTYDTTTPASSLAPKTLTVTGNVPISFTAAAQSDGGLNWLSVTPSSGRTNATVTVSVNPAGLAASATPYTGRIVLSYGSTQLVVPVTLQITTPAAPEITTSSAASGLAVLAPDAIASAYGANLANATAAATSLPLPTVLGGTSVTVKDSAGVERSAPLFFASSTQVNYLIPAGTAVGPATVKIGSATGSVRINSIAPGLFTANSNGQGAPAATAALYAANGEITVEPVFQCSSGVGSCVTVPIPLGAEADQVFLTLYGTGIRGRSSLASVTCRIGGVDAPVVFADAQGGFVGLDQVNVRVPRSLAGRGEVDLVLTVDGQATNTVRVNLQ